MTKVIIISKQTNDINVWRINIPINCNGLETIYLQDCY